MPPHIPKHIPVHIPAPKNAISLKIMPIVWNNKK
jgi:hypothetical protein